MRNRNYHLVSEESTPRRTKRRYSHPHSPRATSSSLYTHTSSSIITMNLLSTSNIIFLIIALFRVADCTYDNPNHAGFRNSNNITTSTGPIQYPFFTIPTANNTNPSNQTIPSNNTIPANHTTPGNHTIPNPPSSSTTNH